MAQENVGINITVGGNTDQAIGSLKSQLREATAEVTKLSEQFGASSKEAVQAAKRAAELKDQIGDAKSLIDAFNPDAKFKALTSSLSGVAGGFAAAQGAIGLFGVESAAVEKTLLKVQSAMALSQGLQSVGESVDSFRQLGAVIKSTSAFQAAYNFVIGEKVAIQKADAATTVASTVATKAQAAATNSSTVATTASSVALKVFRGALLATGIGAIIIALGLLIANFGKIKTAILNAIPGLGKFASTVGNVINAFTDLVGITNAASRAEQQRQAIFAKSSANTKVVNEGIERQIKLIQAQGAEQGKVDVLRKQQINNELKDLKNAVDSKGLLYGEQAKKYKDLQNDLQVIDATAETARREAAEAAAKKGASASNKYGESQKKSAKELAKEKADAEKERADAELVALQKLADLRNQLFLSTIKDENEKKAAELNLAFIKEKDEILANTLITEATKNQLILAARLKLNSDLDALKATEKEKQNAADAKLLEDAATQMAKEDELEFANLQKKFAKTQEDEKKAAAKELADLDKKLLKNETDLQLEKSLLDERDALLEKQYADSLISEDQYTASIDANAKARVDIAKKEADQKIALAQQSAAALTQLSDIVGKATAAGNALAVSAALINTYLGITAGVKLGFPAAIPAVAIAAMTGFSAVKNIIATKVPGGASAGSAGNMTSPSISALAPMAPAQPQAATTNISTQSINALGNQAQRAYVVESDVTSNQQRMAAIQQRARFG
jgi:hypothetical protein